MYTIIKILETGFTDRISLFGALLKILCPIKNHI